MFSLVSSTMQQSKYPVVRPLLGIFSQMLANVLITLVLPAGNTDNARACPFAQDLKNVDFGENLDLSGSADE